MEDEEDELELREADLVNGSTADPFCNGCPSGVIAFAVFEFEEEDDDDFDLL